VRRRPPHRSGAQLADKEVLNALDVLNAPLLLVLRLRLAPASSPSVGSSDARCSRTSACACA
jgi:hypothetical protein